MTNKHILIVEDEQKIAAILKEYLEKSGYRATITGRGDQAVAQVRKSSPDLILLTYKTGSHCYETTFQGKNILAVFVIKSLPFD